MKLYITEFGDRKKALSFAKKKKLGYEIQRFCNPVLIDRLENEIVGLREDIRDIPDRALHGPFLDLTPASRDPRIVDITKLRFNQAYNLTKEINANHLILHSGFRPKTYPPKDWLTKTIKFWHDFMSDKNDKIKVHIENIFENDFSLLSQLIRELNHPAISICLDIGHVNINSEFNVLDWIREIGNNIEYVHLHNNDGIDDDHFGLHKGKINIEAVLNLLKENNPDTICSLETDDLEESFEWLTQSNLLNCFD